MTHELKNEGGHTPGPWMAAAKPSSVVGLPVVATPNGRSIASVTFFALGDAFANHDAESKANAHLIAAAPDLLAALREVVAISDRKTDAWDRAKAAIAKAEGRPHD